MKILILVYLIMGMLNDYVLFADFKHSLYNVADSPFKRAVKDTVVTLFNVLMWPLHFILVIKTIVKLRKGN